MFRGYLQQISWEGLQGETSDVRCGYDWLSRLLAAGFRVVAALDLSEDSPPVKTQRPLFC